MQAGSGQRVQREIARRLPRPMPRLLVQQRVRIPVREQTVTRTRAPRWCRDQNYENYPDYVSHAIFHHEAAVPDRTDPIASIDA